MNFFQKIFTVIIGITVFSNPILPLFAQTSETGVSLEVSSSSVCNYDGVCNIGEDESNCPADCGCNNNGVCEAARGENNSNCPLDCPVTPTEGQGTSGGAVFIPDTTPPLVFNLLISEITVSSAKITWETNEPALCKFIWGKTEEYELESIIETGLYEKHADKLINLLPGATYNFKISCQDAAKNGSETQNQKFSTLLAQDILPPANVSDFSAEEGDQKIDLSWKNPPDSDFKGVKIVRSTNFYPDNPGSGITVYNGDGEIFTDTAVKNGIRYYYTAFTYDKAGNYSSGAIVSGYPHKPGEVVPSEQIPTSTIPITPEIEKLNLEDFDFIQNGVKISPKDGKLNFKNGVPLTASIAYEKVPEVLKTIMVTLSQGEKVFSFLLRINKDKTRYEAIISPPDPGKYPLTINILDYKNQRLKILKGELIVLGESIVGPAKKTFSHFWIYAAIVILILFLMIIFYRFKKRQEKRKQNEKVE